MVKAPCNLCRINEIETLQKLRALKAGQRELRGVTELKCVVLTVKHLLGVGSREENKDVRGWGEE